MTEAWGDLTVREAFGEAARAFAELVRSIPPESWDGPGLGEWSVRDLVGHTSRALITVETYLQQPAETEDVATPAGYLAALGDGRRGRRRRPGPGRGSGVGRRTRWPRSTRWSSGSCPWSTATTIR